MKKNVFMRAALLLLVLTLITSCFVGGTFAKYTTSGSKASETARVAKWGLSVTVASDAAFATTYNEATGAPDANPDELTVEATTNVIAPGTSGNLLTVAYAGTAEVDAQVAVTPVLTLTGFDDYCPIIFTVNNVDYYVGMDANITDASKLAAKVVELLNAANAYREAGTAITDSYTVDWRWDFTKDADLTGNTQNDEDDTVLGNAYTASITFSYNASITQVD